MKHYSPHCNVTALLEVRERIRTEPERLDMDDFECRTDCGTTRCIAGWAVHLAGASVVPETAFDEGQELLGLSDQAAFELFMGEERTRTKDDIWRVSCPVALSEITPAMAVQAIDNVISTGRPNWRSMV